MRHNKSGRQLSRNNSHRKALLRNMSRALLTYEQIRTTEAKAKELRSVVEKLITLALRNDLHSRRLAYKTLGSHQLVQKLFDEIGPRYVGGGGGYTRIVKMTLPRKGDCAPLVIIELTKQAEKVAKAEKAEPEAKAEPKKAKAPAKKKAEPAKAEAKPKKAAKKPAEEGEAKPKKKAAPKKAAAKPTDEAAAE